MRTGPNGEKHAVNVVANVAPSLSVAAAEAEARDVDSGEDARRSQSGNAWAEASNGATKDGAEMWWPSDAQSR